MANKPKSTREKIIINKFQSTLATQRMIKKRSECVIWSDSVGSSFHKDNQLIDQSTGNQHGFV